MKAFLRDLALILIGGAFVLLGKEAFANELPPIAITCGDGEITGVALSEGRMDTVTLSWFANSVTARQNGARLTNCVLSNQ